MMGFALAVQSGKKPKHVLVTTAGHWLLRPKIYNSNVCANACRLLLGPSVAGERAQHYTGLNTLDMVRRHRISLLEQAA